MMEDYQDLAITYVKHSEELRFHKIILIDLFLNLEFNDDYDSRGLGVLTTFHII